MPKIAFLAFSSVFFTLNSGNICCSSVDQNVTHKNFRVSAFKRTINRSHSMRTSKNTYPSNYYGFQLHSPWKLEIPNLHFFYRFWRIRIFYVRMLWGWLMMRLKAETQNFLWVTFWPTLGQHVLPKFGVKKMLEKAKNVIFGIIQNFL